MEKCINIGKARKQEAIRITCVLCSHFDKILYSF